MSSDALSFLGIVRKEELGLQLSPLDGGDEFFFMGFQGQKSSQGGPSAFT